jgi:hypothetical protein
MLSPGFTFILRELPGPSPPFAPDRPASLILERSDRRLKRPFYARPRTLFAYPSILSFPVPLTVPIESTRKWLRVSPSNTISGMEAWARTLQRRGFRLQEPAVRPYCDDRFHYFLFISGRAAKFRLIGVSSQLIQHFITSFISA